MKILVTGAGGLIGSEAVMYFDKQGHQIIGFDNNARRTFFGPDGSIYPTIQRLTQTCANYTHMNVDVSSRGDVMWEIEALRPDVVIHCAAQPSHDRAASIPFVDFDTNAGGTLNLLEATRKYSPHAVFIHMSTNKVYGDLSHFSSILKEMPTRYEILSEEDDILVDYSKGLTEFSSDVDQTMHSLFGASKLAADLMAQEYGRYFGMNVGIFRGGCLTGPLHQGVELHGFLSYIVKCAVIGKEYTVFGYKGKQVRDQIHSHDVITAFDEFIKNPKQGEVYNLGGGRANSASILEIINILKENHGLELKWKYVDEARKGDHQWYITDMSKFQHDYPNWKVTRSLTEIIAEMVNSCKHT